VERFPDCGGGDVYAEQVLRNSIIVLLSVLQDVLSVLPLSLFTVRIPSCLADSFDFDFND
jgi:hypothetical protein